MIQTFRAKNYGCLVDVTATLTPLHAFIGPNDSGKSTILHAIRALSKFAQHNGTQGAMSEFNRYGRERAIIDATVPGTTGAVIARDRSQWGDCFVDPDARDALGGSQTLRLEPESLRHPRHPVVVPIGLASGRAATQRLQVSLRLRTVETTQPVVGHLNRPDAEDRLGVGVP